MILLENVLVGKVLFDNVLFENLLSENVFFECFLFEKVLFQNVFIWKYLQLVECFKMRKERLFSGSSVSRMLLNSIVILPFIV